MPTKTYNTFSQVDTTLMKRIIASNDLAASLIGLGNAYTSVEVEKACFIPC